MRIDIAQLEFIDRQLRDILVYVEAVTGFEFTITSLYRINDTGVHGTLPLRGTDLRMRNKVVAATICQLINERWDYNPASPGKACGYLHGEGSNYHLHVQVHPNTVPK